MSGYNRMPRIIEVAGADIKQHLWSLYWLGRQVKAKVIVELGVRFGDSNRTLCAAALDTFGKVHSFDIEGDCHNVREINLVHGIEPFPEGIWRCTKYDSVLAALTWKEPNIDLLFIDTVHSLEHTRAEITAWYRKIRPGGIMAFHDVGLKMAGGDGVLPAMKEFFGNNPEWEMEYHVDLAPGDCGMGWATKKGEGR